MFLFEKLNNVNKVRHNRNSKRRSPHRRFRFEQLEERVVMDASGGLGPSLPYEVPMPDDVTQAQEQPKTATRQNNDCDDHQRRGVRRAE